MNHERRDPGNCDPRRLGDLDGRHSASVNTYEKAQAAAKAAFKTMMDAATKAANLATMMAEVCTDPEQANAWRLSAREWQNSASVAYQHWSQL